jgi:methylated-DNA-protein-cysteine methyltransferase related protein
MRSETEGITICDVCGFAQAKTRYAPRTYGKLLVIGQIGLHLDVMPRHVAYILTMLSPAEKDSIPWYRVVSDDGTISAPKTAKSIKQIEFLATEGIVVDRAKKINDFETVFLSAPNLGSNIEQQ